MSKCPFYCPCCGEETKAKLLLGLLFASPNNEAVIQCGVCKTKFRIELWVVEEEEGEEINDDTSHS